MTSATSTPIPDNGDLNNDDVSYLGDFARGGRFGNRTLISLKNSMEEGCG